MATSSQRQGADEDVEIVPAAQQEPWDEIVASLATRVERPSSKEEIRWLEDLHATAPELIQAAGPGRVTHVIARRCLAFMKMELRGIIALLKSRDSPLNDHDANYDPQRQWMRHMQWLKQYARYLLEKMGKPRCFPCLLGRRRRSEGWIAVNSYEEAALKFCLKIADTRSVLEYSGWYKDLLLVDIPTPQVAKESGIPLVGINRPINKLFRWLMLREETHRSLSVMSIVGPVGIGKTTLAMELQNRLECQVTGGPYYFDCNIMVHVSRRSRTTNRNKILLQDILSKIYDPATPAPQSDSPPATMRQLVTLVSERLQNKRYFICIDDMSKASDWREIRDAFPDNNLGSRILITTNRPSIIWSFPFDSYTHVDQMKPLNWSNSERLLLTRAFGGHGPGMRPSFRRLLNHCGGIPLIINVVADCLKQHFRLGMELSEEYLEGDWCDMLSQEPNLIRYCRGALAYTIADLASAYKELILLKENPYTWVGLLLFYMTMFPCGYKFEKDHLITKWFYEGLADDVDAEVYFSLLIDSNIITSSAENFKSSQDGTEALQLHMNYFMQKVLASRSAEIGFSFTDATLNLADASTPRRLALHHPNPLIPSLSQKLDLSQTRSLAVSGAVDGVPLDAFDYLVVLDLEGWEKLTDDVLQKVCTSKMSFLQYLSVRNTQVSKLPSEIKNLCSLMELDISYTQITELALEVLELKDTLRSIICGSGGMVLNGTAIRVPYDIPHLASLVKLVTIDLSEQPASFLEALGSLIHLQILAITWSFHQSTDRSYCEALLSSIKKWYNLESLTIHCGLGCSMDFLGSLSPDQFLRLKEFKVTVGRLASLPKWVNKNLQLSFLQITICKQGIDDLNILGDLRHLQCLILGLDFIPGEAIEIGNYGFNRLKRFSVDCPMPWLSFSTGAMRKLTYLQLKFRAIPVSQSTVPSGLENLLSLSEVALCYNEHYANSPSIKMTVKAVKKQVHKYCNLFINGTEDNVQDLEEKTDNSVATQSGTVTEINIMSQRRVDEDVATKFKSTCEIEEIQSDG